MENIPYLNPIALFDAHPEIENYFLNLTDFGSAKGELAHSFPAGPAFPGSELVKEFYENEEHLSFGSFMTAKLIASGQAEYAGSKSLSAIEEREALAVFTAVLDDVIKKAKAKHTPENDPNIHMPYSYEDQMAWKGEKDQWDRESQKIARMEALRERPYTLHIRLEDETNVFINEDDNFGRFFMDVDFPELVAALEPTIFIGKYFDKVRLGQPYEEEVHLLRQNQKSTFRGKRIALKRSVDIRGGAIVNSTDIFVDNFSSEGPKTTDPFLQDVYYKRRGDANISNIIETIQSNQMDIVAYPYDQHIFVQGVAGSGKTMVLLQRLSDFAAKDPKMDQSTIVFVQPNKEFGTYFEPYFGQKGIGGVTRKTMADYLMQLVERYYFQFSENAYVESGSSGRISALRAGPNRVKEKNLLYHWSQRTCGDKDVREIRAENLYSAFLTRTTRLVLKQHKVKKIRVDLPSRADFDVAKKKGFAGNYEAWTKHIRGDDPSFSSKNPYVDLADFERLIAEQLKALRGKQDKDIPLTFAGLGKEETNISTALAYSLLFLLHEKYGPLEERYQDKLIAIDECQDYNYRVFQLIHETQPKAVFNLFGDIAQDIGFHGAAWDKYQAIAEQIEKHVDFVFYKFALRENYRNSQEILDFCKANFGIKSESYGVSTMLPQRIDVKRLIALLSYHKTLGDRSVVIYDRKYEKAVDTYLKPLFKKYGLGEVEILDPVDAKGMEYDNVFIVGYGDMNFNERYVACTRAFNELYIVQTRITEAEQ